MDFFSGEAFLNNLLFSIVLIALVTILRFFILKTLSKWRFPDNETRRRWIVTTRNATLLLFVLGLLLIWSVEIKEFALSIVAVAVAFVVATKEVLVCIMGGFLRYSGNLFSIGDRVEIGDIRGDVINHNIVVTTIYEIGPGKEMHQFTGRVVVVPNSVFLSTPVLNETETGKFSLHVFRIPFPRESNWQAEAPKILNCAKLACASYYQDARNEFERIAKREGLDMQKVEPRIQIHYHDEKRVDIVVRLPVPARAKGRIEQAVLMNYAGLQTLINT